MKFPGGSGLVHLVGISPFRFGSGLVVLLAFWVLRSCSGDLFAADPFPTEQQRRAASEGRSSETNDSNFLRPVWAVPQPRVTVEAQPFVTKVVAEIPKQDSQIVRVALKVGATQDSPQAKAGRIELAPQDVAEAPARIVLDNFEDSPENSVKQTISAVPEGNIKLPRPLPLNDEGLTTTLPEAHSTSSPGRVELESVGEVELVPLKPLRVAANDQSEPGMTELPPVILPDQMGSSKGILGRAGYFALESFGRDESLSDLEILPYVFDGQSLLYSDMRFFLSEGERLGANLGIGFRRTGADPTDWAGGSIWFDLDSVQDETFTQIGLGIDGVYGILEGRVNGYIPLSSRKQLGAELVNSVVDGGNLRVISARSIASPMAGLDWETGLSTHWQQFIVRGYIGSYHFFSDDSDSIHGVKVRGELEHEYLTFSSTFTHDKKFGSDVTFGVGIQWPGRKSRMPQFNALSTPLRFARRNHNIILDRSVEVAEEVFPVLTDSNVETPAPAEDPVIEEPINNEDPVNTPNQPSPEEPPPANQEVDFEYALIAPSDLWDGTLDWVGRDVPEDPERVEYKPIAHFAIVPFQDVNDDFIVPVVSFSKGGIASVSFHVEGTDVEVASPQIVSEFDGKPFEAYVVELDASEFPDHDGAFEVYATVTPNDPSAQERVISMQLFSNINGTLPTQNSIVDAVNGSDDSGDGTSSNPFATITRAKEALRLSGGVSGGTILLRNGEYEYASITPELVDNERWLTITADAGHSPVITHSGEAVSGGLRVKRVKISNVDLNTSGTVDNIPIRNSLSRISDASLWLDDLKFTGPGAGTLFTRPAHSFDKYYYTDFTATDAMNGLMFGELARNITLEHIGADAFYETKAVIGATVHEVGNANPEFHPDIWQWQSGDFENALLYGVWTGDAVTAQGVFFNDFEKMRDVAVINSLIRSQSVLTSQLIDVDASHFVMLGNTIDQTLNIRENGNAGHELEYFEVVDNLFLRVVTNIESLSESDNSNVWSSNFFIEENHVFGLNPLVASPDWDPQTMTPNIDGNLKSTRNPSLLLDVFGNRRTPGNHYFGALQGQP